MEKQIFIRGFNEDVVVTAEDKHTILNFITLGYKIRESEGYKDVDIHYIDNNIIKKLSNMSFGVYGSVVCDFYPKKNEVLIFLNKKPLIVTFPIDSELQNNFIENIS